MKETRIRTAEANAYAVKGENEAKVEIANSEAYRREKEAEAQRKASAAEKVQQAKALQEAYAAEREAEEARAEGFSVIADLFERVASVEKQHEQNYRQALQEVREGKVFQSDNPQQKWICINCGYVVEGTEPPKICPTCSHPQGYFKIQQS